MLTRITFKPPVAGEVRGAFRSSRGNPMPWQACVYTGRGWVYFFGMSPADALAKAKNFTN